MEWPLHSRQNGHSIPDRMGIPIRPDWNATLLIILRNMLPGAPWQFWIFEVLIERIIKKLIGQKLIGGSNNLAFDIFPDLVGHFGLSR